jgi:hypothetical protein
MFQSITSMQILQNPALICISTAWWPRFRSPKTIGVGGAGGGDIHGLQWCIRRSHEATSSTLSQQGQQWLDCLSLLIWFHSNYALQFWLNLSTLHSYVCGVEQCMFRVHVIIRFVSIICAKLFRFPIISAHEIYLYLFRDKYVEMNLSDQCKH